MFGYSLGLKPALMCNANVNFNCKEHATFAAPVHYIGMLYIQITKLYLYINIVSNQSIKYSHQSTIHFNESTIYHIESSIHEYYRTAIYFQISYTNIKYISQLYTHINLLNKYTSPLLIDISSLWYSPIYPLYKLLPIHHIFISIHYIFNAVNDIYTSDQCIFIVIVHSRCTLLIHTFFLTVKSPTMSTANISPL